MGNKVIDNRFLVLRQIGEGAAGEVMEASVINDTPYATKGTRLALKMYKPWVFANENQAFRIERELLSGINISSPNIVKTYEVGSHAGRVYLVMERLDGISLRQWMDKHKKLSFSDLINIISGIAQGLCILHSHKLIHRDIKPENIMITSRGSVILDLGVLQNISTETVITGGEFLGTIKYAAPEYLFGEEYTNNIDIYSFGLILYELLTSKSIFEDNLYWSKLIVEKSSRLYITSDYDYHYKLNYSRLGKLHLKERVFLKAILDGCLTSSDHSYGYSGKTPKRISSAQLNEALTSHLWEKTFAYPVSEWNSSIDLWPNLDSMLEKKVEEFITNRMASLSGYGAEILWNVADQNNGHFSLIFKKDLPAEKSNLFKWLLGVGLIEDGHDDYGENIYEGITPLAWQLIFRGIINSGVIK